MSMDYQRELFNAFDNRDIRFAVDAIAVILALYLTGFIFIYSVSVVCETNGYALFDCGSFTVGRFACRGVLYR